MTAFVARDVDPSQPDDPIAFAAFYDETESVCTMTTEPNAEMTQIHDRMPVILLPEAWDTYLDPNVTDPQTIAPLLISLQDGSLTMEAVDPVVNNARNESPDCLRPAPKELFDAEA